MHGVPENFPGAYPGGGFGGFGPWVTKGRQKEEKGKERKGKERKGKGKKRERKGKKKEKDKST